MINDKRKIQPKSTKYAEGCVFPRTFGHAEQKASEKQKRSHSSGSETTKTLLLCVCEHLKDIKDVI